VSKTDTLAEETNVQLADMGLPLLPPVDGVDQWDAITSNFNARPEPLAISANAIVQYRDGGLFKLITGVQPYSGWTSAIYPNCSMYCPPEPMFLFDGPQFVDLKVWQTDINPALTENGTERVFWNKDCSDGCLYDVLADPGEHDDLSLNTSNGLYVEIKESLMVSLAQANTTIFKPDRGPPSLDACTRAMRNNGIYGPFVSTPWGEDVSQWYTTVKFPLEPKLLALLGLLALDQGVALVKLMQAFIPLAVKSCYTARNIEVCLSNPACYAGRCLGERDVIPNLVHAMDDHEVFANQTNVRRAAVAALAGYLNVTRVLRAALIRAHARSYDGVT
jgi:hypothetical protein